MLDAARMLYKKGLPLYATAGTSDFLSQNGIPNVRVYWPGEPEKEPQSISLMRSGNIDMVVNIPRDLTPRELSIGYKVRRAAVDMNILLITNDRLASAFVSAFCSVDIDSIPIKSWNEFKEETI